MFCVADNIPVGGFKVPEMTDKEMMIRAGFSHIALAERDEVPLVQFQIRPAESDAVLKRKDVVNLHLPLIGCAGFARSAFRLGTQMSISYFIPLRTAVYAVLQGNECAGTSVIC
jgi:hypothetical protein